jgi:hypothetical protein
VANLVLLVVCLGLGAGLRRARVLPDATPAVLNTWVLYVALPALVVRRLAGVHVDASVLVPASMAWLQVGLVAGLVAAVGPRVGWDRPTRAALVLTAGFGNTSFVGYPLLEALRGPGALPVAVLCDQLGSFVALATVGIVVATTAAGGSVAPRALAARILRFPPLWALVVALAIGSHPLPAWLAGVLDRLGDTLGPLALAAIGFQLRLRGTGPSTALTAGLVTKLVVVPLVLLGLYRAVGVPPDSTLAVTVLEAGMAPMITGALLAADRGLAPELASRMVGLGVPLSLLTVPAWQWVLDWLGIGTAGGL